MILTKMDRFVYEVLTLISSTLTLSSLSWIVCAIKSTALFMHPRADDNRSPDFLITSPHGGGRLIQLDVLYISVNGLSRRNDEDPNKPIEIRLRSK